MERICENCKHGQAVIDDRVMEDRWVCLKYLRVLDDPTFLSGRVVKGCLAFEPRVPQVPYIPRPLDPRMVADLRFHMLQVENILRVLEREQIPPQRKGLE